MARIEDTGGNITYTIDNCDCGLTGGCWKCQPIHISGYGSRDYLSPEFMDENLREFYRKKGLLYRHEL